MAAIVSAKPKTVSRRTSMLSLKLASCLEWCGGTLDQDGPLSPMDTQQPLPLEKVRILVVENEALIAIQLECELEDAGAIVVGPVPLVSEALALIEEGQFDAAIMNVNLNDGPSYPAAEALREKGKPFMFVTAFEHTMLPGAMASVPVLSKPLTAAQLVNSLVSLLEQAASGAPGLALMPGQSEASL